jgi:hypothetical protein
MKINLLTSGITLALSMSIYAQTNNIERSKESAKLTYQSVQLRVNLVKSLNRFEDLFKTNSASTQLESALFFGYDSQGALNSEMKTVYAYDALGRQTHEVISEYNGVQWYDVSRDSLEHTPALITKTTYVQNNGVWEKSKQWRYGYNSQGLASSIADYGWYNGAWTGGYKSEFVYDNQGRVDTLYALRGDSLSGTWEPSLRLTYTYDNNGNLLEELAESWDGWAYVLSSKIVYTYNAANQQTEMLGQYYIFGIWNNLFKTITDYTTQGWIEKSIWWFWNDPFWDESSRDEFWYDAHGNNTLYTLTANMNGTWEVLNKTERTFETSILAIDIVHPYLWRANHENQLKTETNSKVDGGPLTITDSTIFNYTQFVSVFENQLQNVRVYGNTSKELIIENELEQEIKLTLVNGNGQTLLKRNVHQQRELIELSEIPSGIVLVQLQSKGMSLVEKIIVQ